MEKIRRTIFAIAGLMIGFILSRVILYRVVLPVEVFSGSEEGVSSVFEFMSWSVLVVGGPAGSVIGYLKGNEDNFIKRKVNFTLLGVGVGLMFGVGFVFMVVYPALFTLALPYPSHLIMAFAMPVLCGLLGGIAGYKVVTRSNSNEIESHH